MKPVANTGEKSAAVTITTENQAQSTSGKKKCVISAVVGCGLFILLLISGTVIGSMYLGSNLCRENSKDAWVTFYNGEGESPLKEKFRLADEELTITRPGVLSMVVDYSRNVVVTQLDTELEGDKDPKCYVTDMDEKEFGNFEAAAERITQDRINFTVPFDNEEILYRSTSEHVPAEVLSKSAREMCFGSIILKMSRTDNTEPSRVRRGWNCENCTIKCKKVCFLFFCSRKCWTDCECTFQGEGEDFDKDGPVESLPKI